MKPLKIIKGTHNKPVQYYDLTVDDYACFPVGNKKIIVHNSSLMQAIVGMAQDFVGANNLPLLMPSGQFGTRANPSASASPRYIFTYLNPLTRYIFRKEDDSILNYLNEDGQDIEPEFYLPIIPMLLVNGAAGIGTGWSTDIPKYDPMDLIEIVKRKLVKENLKYQISPAYKGWKGELDWNEEKNSYTSKGIFKPSKKGVIITELPIDLSTDKFIATLDKLVDEKKIKSYIDNSTDTTVNVEVVLNGVSKDVAGLLKLSNSISMNNMNTFLDNKIVKWTTTEDMINTWIDIRLGWYEKRKIQWMSVLEQQFDRYDNLLGFIKGVIDGEILINNRKKDVIIKDLEAMDFMKINDSYDYLLNIPVYHFTTEKFEEYKKMAKNMRAELKEYKLMNPADIWQKDLKELEEQLIKAGY